jgi:hypothetical protein
MGTCEGSAGYMMGNTEGLYDSNGVWMGLTEMKRRNFQELKCDVSLEQV